MKIYPNIFVSFLFIIGSVNAFEYIDDSNYSTDFSENFNLQELQYLDFTTLEAAKYVKSPHVTQDVWEIITPYLLPEDHPIKPELDRIFSASRVTANRDTLKEAGFKSIQRGKWSHATVAKHPNLKGYLLKLYLDKESNIVDWEHWRDRILGANETQKAIDKHGYQSMFKVPKKWIYPLPTDPAPLPGYERRNFILVVEDMHLLSKKENLAKWSSSKVSTRKLDAIFTVLKEVGLWDNVYAFNLPFSKDGRIAFIDTEYFLRWPIKYKRLSPYLSKDRKAYWKKLIASDGPQAQ